MPLTTVKQWEQNFRAAGLKEGLIQAHLEYVGPLLDRGLPVIFDFEHLSLLLGRTREFLAHVVNASEYFYREFKIPKRSGGVRTIAAPYPSLLECQRWINKYILSKVKVSRAAHGFIVKRSIITNAKVHLNQEHFLKLDLKEFFPSIKLNWIISVFSELGYSSKVSFYLASICCCHGCLPQGSPASPALSNIVSRHLDNRLLKFAKRFKFKYSRYADDIAFTGDEITAKHIEYVVNIIEDCGFEVNSLKTKLQTKRGKRILTGISIAKENPEVPKEFRRKLEQELYYIRKFSLRSHMRSRKIRVPNYLCVLLGKLHFWHSVEPGNDYVASAIEYLQGEDGSEPSS